MANSIYNANMKRRSHRVNAQVHELLPTAYELLVLLIVLPQLNVVFGQFIYH